MSFVVHTEQLNLVSATAEAAEESNGSTDESVSHVHDVVAVFHLAIPTMVIQLSGTLPSFIIASYIGRNYPVTYLDGYTLATLTGNLFTLSILSGLYSASDTLSPQAYGAGNSSEVGYLAIRGFVSSVSVTVPPVLVLGCTMNRILSFVGEDDEASKLAWHWYQIYIVSIPFYALYQCTMKFLLAQVCTTPLVLCVLTSCLIVLPTFLLLLGKLFGYLGTAGAYVIYQVFLSISLIGYLWLWKPHDIETWPGLSQGWKPALQQKPLMAYMALGAGGMLASSEWIYWELLSLMVGTFGVVPLSVHTIPTQVILFVFMLPLAIGIALSVRLGAILPNSVSRAKRTARDCTGGFFILFGLICTGMYTERRTIYGLFTTSDLVVAGCDEIWWKVVVYTHQLSLFGLLMGTCVGLGIQWILGITTIVILWGFGLPVAYYMSVVKNGGLNAAWSAIWPPYVIINLALMASIVRADWDKIADDIRTREGMVLLNISKEEKESIGSNRYGSLQAKHEAT